ncbi:hypothetical protein OKW28_000912 [Paraburkholderia sp. 40]
MVTHGRDFVFFITSFYRRLPINLTKPLPPLRRLSLYLLRAVNEGVMSCPRGECGRSARPVRVNRAVVEMDPVTQPNAALVEEAAVAAHSLKVQVDVLREAIENFSLPA